MSAICSRTDPSGVKTTYSYDALSRLKSRLYSDSTPTAYYYYDELSFTSGKTVYTLANTKGRLSHTSTGSGATLTLQSYDAMGHVTSYWQSCASGDICAPMQNSLYSYDLAGDEISFTHPWGYTITQTFNGAQRITGITSTDGGTLATMSYTPFGAAAVITGLACPSCAAPVQTFDYNNRLQMVREQFGSPSQPNAISCIVYNYYSNQPIPGGCDVPAQGAGNNGQLRSDYDNDEASGNPNRVAYPSSHTDTYTYDSLGRLTQAVATPFDSGYFSENLTYSYDDFGNMTCVQNPYTNGNCPQITSDPATNRMTLVGTAAPTYDTNGNLLTDATTLNTYSYDAEGRLTKINNSQHVSITYTYNALGQLVEDDRSNWGGTDNEILYDAFGRRIGDYANGTRGYGFWQNEYVPSRKPDVTYTNAPDAGDSWQSENASPQDAIGNYRGDASTSSSSEWTQYRNQMGSKRWGTANGEHPAADSLYDPHGNEWYVCSIYGSGASSYADFGIYCVCYGPTIDANGRPYFSRLGIYMGPLSQLVAYLLNPNSLNGYGRDDGDPINKSAASNDNPIWIKLGDTWVKINPLKGEDFGQGQHGVDLQAFPQGCDNCSWAQTVKRTGYGAEPEHTDRVKQEQPMYPSNGLPTNKLWDDPASTVGQAGTFRAVSTLGVPNYEERTFTYKGSMTWGYQIDEYGNVTPYQPRLATPAEQQRSIQILQRESPGWTIIH
ncbi:MAG TPA: hypothetical protein VNM47_18250 [Terriglobia bacterium]|nr:hypothetical protein [Terriglobia bacterium]